MRIYISGISGTAMGPLALFSKEAGLTVSGSDLSPGPVLKELTLKGIDFYVGPQDGSFLRSKLAEASAAGEKIDWFIYTSALPASHPELLLAKEQGIKCSKRDEFIPFLLKHLNLKLVAVAGTHGKTTTTAGIVYLCLKLGLPASWLVGTTLGFAGAGTYTPGSKYLIYEADEYDRNFLAYHPDLSLIPSISYDHPDTYPTPEDYNAAFYKFMKQSRTVIVNPSFPESELKISGPSRRHDLALAADAISWLIKDYNTSLDFSAAEADLKASLAYSPAPSPSPKKLSVEKSALATLLSSFPGVGRRMEKIAPGIYSDYAHHPEEISATLKMAKEEAKLQGKKGVVALYEPHQNLRQHKIRSSYRSVFRGIDKLFWLPTFLTRENPDLPVIPPEDFISDLENLEIAEPAELSERLALRLKTYLSENYLLLLMSAGPADSWFRANFKETE